LQHEGTVVAARMLGQNIGGRAQSATAGSGGRPAAVLLCTSDVVMFVSDVHELTQRKVGEGGLQIHFIPAIPSFARRKRSDFRHAYL
jgi:hypothetical protein